MLFTSKPLRRLRQGVYDFGVGGALGYIVIFHLKKKTVFTKKIKSHWAYLLWKHLECYARRIALNSRSPDGKDRLLSQFMLSHPMKCQYEFTNICYDTYKNY